MKNIIQQISARAMRGLSVLSIARRAALTLFAALTLTTVFGAAQSAQAQLRSFVDCVEKVDNSHYRAYFGYVSYYEAVVSYSPDSPDNYFTPVSQPPGQPSDFYPGIHRRVIYVVLPNNTNETWVLEQNFAEASSGQTLLPCADAGSNTRTITYQGRLTDANVAANGQYDLRFQLFNAATNGTSQSAALEFDSVSVINGIFTVQLDFALLPAFLEGGNLFLEIGVRPGAATGNTAYTTLAPRQPLTAAPYAIRAQSAANADLLNGLSANDFIRNGTQGQGANFNIYGNGTINGSLTVTGAINGTVTNATNATNSQQLGGVAAGQYVQTNDTRLSNARTPTAGSENYIQNTTTQQTGNFNISGNGTIGGTLAANTVNASSTTDTVLRGMSSSTVGTRLALRNTTTGGTTWNVISTGSGNGEGAGKLVFFNETSNTAPLQINGGGANIIGNLTVTGAISGATKNFKIDNPLDPLNKTLIYTSVESPDMKNIYDGNVTTDANGEAIVTMPDYFEALNKDFRYQLTVIGTFSQAIVLEKIKGNQFKIKTDKPNVEVSWQVTGIRQDKFAEDNRPKVEETKSIENQGKCLYEPACQNKPKE